MLQGETIVVFLAALQFLSLEKYECIIAVSVGLRVVPDQSSKGFRLITLFNISTFILPTILKYGLGSNLGDFQTKKF